MNMERIRDLESRIRELKGQLHAAIVCQRASEEQQLVALLERLENEYAYEQGWVIHA